jgi:hypothetical protein
MESYIRRNIQVSMMKLQLLGYATNAAYGAPPRSLFTSRALTENMADKVHP